MNDQLVCYVDFDGVFHAFDEDAIDEYGRLLPNPNLFQWLPLLSDALEPFPEVKNIVSSDWRRLFSDENLVKLLGPLGDRFIGVVAVQFRNRAEEIQKDAADRKLLRWFAIDDHESVVRAGKLDDRFIPCKPHLGLSEASVIKKIIKKATLYKASQAEKKSGLEMAV